MSAYESCRGKQLENESLVANGWTHLNEVEKLDGFCDGVGHGRTGIAKEDYLHGIFVEHPKESFHAVGGIALQQQSESDKSPWSVGPNGHERAVSHSQSIR